MRLYKTNFTDDEADANRHERATWSGTQADAGKDRKQLRTDGMRNIETQEVDVPTDKKGLLEFLNTWAVVR